MRQFAAGTIAVMALIVLALPAPARAAEDQQQIVARALLTYEKLSNSEEVGRYVGDLMRRAKAVVIFPSVLKGAFFFGAEGGSGVLLARGGGGQWSYPAFYTMGSASFGLQIGGQAAEMMLIIMTDKGLNAVLNSKVKLGGDIAAAMGPVGVGAEAATTANLGADIYTYSVNEGAFLGASVAGAVIYPRAEWTHAYYGDPGATAPGKTGRAAWRARV